MNTRFAAAAGLLLLSACKDGGSGSTVQAPGSEKSTRTATLEAGAAMMQTMPPIGAINAYLDGFHFYSGRMQQQMEAHHYCAILNEDVIQAAEHELMKKLVHTYGSTRGTRTRATRCRWACRS
jgi:hypothetical protein